MNTIIVTSVPQVDFNIISIEMPQWKEVFREWIRERKPICYDIDFMPTVPHDICKELDKQRYVEKIVESDMDRVFLVPR